MAYLNGPKHDSLTYLQFLSNNLPFARAAARVPL
jgi:hypothetical protein